jgi:hypothetical protein
VCRYLYLLLIAGLVMINIPVLDRIMKEWNLWGRFLRLGKYKKVNWQ